VQTFPRFFLLSKLLFFELSLFQKREDFTYFITVSLFTPYLGDQILANMKFEAATIKDIAKTLNISTSTVSRALNDHYAISPETKKLVLACAEKLNYHPNPAALSLRERKTLSIGVVVCEIANSFFSQIINGIESLASEKGYNVIISQTHESYVREVADLDFLSSRSIDGLLISISAETKNLDHLKELHKMGLPIVFFDRIVPDIKTHSVVLDNFKGAYDATKLLLQNGYTKIAAVAGSKFLPITNERLAGYVEALRCHNLQPDNDYIKYCFYGGMKISEAEDVINELLNLPHRPDAIFVTMDKLTTGCLTSLYNRGIIVPDDLAIAGFSNSDIAHLLRPSLTTVRQPALEMGRVAAELLLQLITSKRQLTEFQKRVFAPELIIRDSSGVKKAYEIQ